MVQRWENWYKVVKATKLSIIKMIKYWLWVTCLWVGMNASGDTLDDERKGNLALQHAKTKTLSLLHCLTIMMIKTIQPSIPNIPHMLKQLKQMLLLGCLKEHHPHPKAWMCKTLHLFFKQLNIPIFLLLIPNLFLYPWQHKKCGSCHI